MLVPHPMVLEGNNSALRRPPGGRGDPPRLCKRSGSAAGAGFDATVGSVMPMAIRRRITPLGAFTPQLPARRRRLLAGAAIPHEACNGSLSRAACSRRFTYGIALPTAIITPSVMQLPIQFSSFLLCVVFTLTSLVHLYAEIMDSRPGGHGVLVWVLLVGKILVEKHVLCLFCSIVSIVYKVREPPARARGADRRRLASGTANSPSRRPAPCPLDGTAVGRSLGTSCCTSHLLEMLWGRGT